MNSGCCRARRCPSRTPCELAARHATSRVARASRSGLPALDDAARNLGGSESSFSFFQLHLTARLASQLLFSQRVGRARRATVFHAIIVQPLFIKRLQWQQREGTANMASPSSTPCCCPVVAFPRGPPCALILSALVPQPRIPVGAGGKDASRVYTTS